MQRRTHLTVVSDDHSTSATPSSRFQPYQRKRGQTTKSSKATIADVDAFCNETGLVLAQCSDYHFKMGSVNIFLPKLKVTIDSSTTTGKGFIFFAETLLKLCAPQMSAGQRSAVQRYIKDNDAQYTVTL